MAISTYAELKAAIPVWMAREGDTELEGQAATFVALAESRLKRDLQMLRMVADTDLTGTADSRELELPADFLEPVALFLTSFGDRQMLKPMVAGTFEYGTVAGVPDAWCINGENIDLDVPCNDAHTFSFRYRQTFALSDDEDTNWLLTNHPDVYLAACLVEAWMFRRNAAEATSWETRYTDAIERINWRDSRQTSLATLSVDPAIGARRGFNIYEG